jgi:predicted DNA-binding helix-hairpin-helix protein
MTIILIFNIIRFDFMKLYSMNVVEGVFISSGICGTADDTTEEIN